MISEEDFVSQRKRLVERLQDEGIIRSQDVARAFLKVPREEFVWPNSRRYAYADTPLPLGETGQTISAPHMVAIMLEELEAKQSMRVLEIGAGSGYNAALLAELVNPTKSKGDGSVTTVERSETLVNFARANIQRTEYSLVVRIVLGDGTLGYPERSEEELYDRVIVTAAAPYIPRYLKAQLKAGGILLVPVGDLWMQSLVKASKQATGQLETRDVCGCMFVPLIGENGHR